MQYGIPHDLQNLFEYIKTVKDEVAKTVSSYICIHL